MLTSFSNDSGLELRDAGDGSRRLTGRFPYGKRAVLSDGGRNGGRPRKEVIQSKAFAYRVDRPEEDIHLLLGHSYDKPLASREAQTLVLTDTDDALTFEAIITQEIQQTTWAQDFFAAYAGGQIKGISPGFRIPPPRTVKNAETVEDEDPSEGTAIIRNIWQALLYEISFVTQPAYKETEIEERNWQLTDAGVVVPKINPLNKWRL